MQEYYRGDTAAAIASGVQAAGGFLSTDDLARFSPDRTQGLRGSHRGYEIITSSGPNGGVTLLEMLNLAENFGLGGMGRFSAACVHLIVEIMRQAWTDRFVYVGDPDRMPVPLSGLVEKSYAAGLTAGLPTDRRPERTRPGDPWAHHPVRSPVGHRADR